MGHYLLDLHDGCCLLLPPIPPPLPLLIVIVCLSHNACVRGSAGPRVRITVTRARLYAGEDYLHQIWTSSILQPYHTMHSPHSSQGASKQSASLEERQELSAVVDGNVVSDQHPLPKSVDAPFMLTLDKVVVAVVIVGIIVFASFQISQCVGAYANPATQTTVDNVTRTFPGIMLCPFSAPYSSFCPQWSPQASLSFDFKFAQVLDCPPDLAAIVTNTNADRVSQDMQSKLSNSCPLNQASQYPYASQSPSLYFGTSYKDKAGTLCRKDFTKLVTVKNSMNRMSGNCRSITPPNVQCLVFDPSSFDDAAATIPGLNPICNPLRELNANSKNSVQLSVNFCTFETSGDCYGGYTYSGRLDASSSFSISVQELIRQGKVPNCRFSNEKMSIFGGVVAVLYDASKGIPQELDFNGAQSNQMSDSDLGSTVLLSTNCYSDPGVPKDSNTCVQYQSPNAVSALVSNQVDQIFTNAVASAKKNITSQTVSLQNSIIDGAFYGIAGRRFQLSMRFSSSVSVITTPIISLTILTTISIILSTAGTLWGSQEKIKEGIILATTKVKEFLEKRRAV